MDFTKEGLIQIEDKPGEGEILGQAVSLGQACIDVVLEDELDRTDEQVGAMAIGVFLIPDLASSNVGIEMIRKFKSAKINALPRVLDPYEGSALYPGLAIMDSVSKSSDLNKRFLAEAGGRNGFDVFMDRNKGKKAHQYRLQLEHAMGIDLVKEL